RTGITTSTRDECTSVRAEVTAQRVGIDEPRKGAMAVIFPKWTNRIPTLVAVGLPVAITGLVFAIWYWFSPEFTDVGYQPLQPVQFSHALHAGELGLDCRYCHNTVEAAAHAAIPPTQTCMNCHTQVRGADRDTSDPNSYS